jgi:protein-disulfide isomerase
VILGIAVAVVVVLVTAYFAFWSGSGGTAAGAQAGPAAVTITASDMTLGSPKAPIKVVEYGAPSCPVCARFEMDNFDQLKKTYIDTGKVYFVFRVFPINGAADGAAEGLARCAGKSSPEGYFHFIDQLFRNQKDWDPEFGPPDGVHAGLLKLARVAGIEGEADACMGDKANAERVNQTAKDAVNLYNINATPTLVINGVVEQPGYMEWSALKSMLDSFLAKAHA